MTTDPKIAAIVQLATDPPAPPPDGPDPVREYFESVLRTWSDRTAAADQDKRTPMERSRHFAEAFQANANQLAMAYGGPVYLVGSMLRSVEPGDCDLRVMLSREDLELWFGKDFESRGATWSPAKWRLEREQLKQSRRLSKRWRGYPARRFDLQFQSALFSDIDGLPIMREGPYLRLDVTPLDYFGAGHGSA